MVHKPKRKVPIAPAQMIKRPFPKQSDELMPLGEVTSPFLSSYMCRNLCWKQFILEIWHRADYTQHRAPVFSAPTRLRDYFPSLPCMQIQLPGFTFRSLKAGPQTQVENDKSLRSSHFSAKTILQCVDSALPPLPTFGGRSGPRGSCAGTFYWLLDKKGLEACACCRWGFKCKHTHGNTLHHGRMLILWRSGYPVLPSLKVLLFFLKTQLWRFRLCFSVTVTFTEVNSKPGHNMAVRLFCVHQQQQQHNHELKMALHEVGLKAWPNLVVASQRRIASLE